MTIFLLLEYLFILIQGDSKYSLIYIGIENMVVKTQPLKLHYYFNLIFSEFGLININIKLQDQVII